jgi:5-methylcytosine-specific restriction endonuclease McrA
MSGSCAICGREETLTRHHLIPRTRHHNKRNKREFERAVVRQVVGICRACHSQIHALLSEKELEREFNTVAKLKAHPGVAKFADWIATKPRGFKAAVQQTNDRRSAR